MIDDDTPTPFEHLRYAAPELLATGHGLRCLYDPYWYSDPSRPVTHTREQVREITHILARHAPHILASNARCVARHWREITERTGR